METQIFQNNILFQPLELDFFEEPFKPSSAGNASFYCTFLPPTIKITHFL